MECHSWRNRLSFGDAAWKIDWERGVHPDALTVTRKQIAVLEASNE